VVSTVGGYIADSTAFLFTLVNPNNTPLKLPVLPTLVVYSTYQNPGYGPTFGGGQDLHIADSCSSNTNSYAKSYSYTFPNVLAGSAGDLFLRLKGSLLANKIISVLYLQIHTPILFAYSHVARHYS